MKGENTSWDAPDSGGEDTGLAPEQQGNVAKRAFLSRKLGLRILAILMVIGITASIFIFRDSLILSEEAEDLKNYGYLGAFVVALISSATVVLPVPGIVVIFLLGEFLNPIVLGLVAGVGSALGEITGYMAGFSGQAVLEKSRYYPRLEGWVKRRGSIVIFVLSFVPNPFFDVAGATAGALRFPLWKFLLMCFLGKSLRYMLIAFAGASTMDWVREFLEKYF
ncbi:MAG: VTT domain-containing protein [Dehalococcoidia bacterium]